MAESDLKNFNCDAFAKDLSSQASQVVPNDIKKQDKDFIVEIIYRFCKMAGDALANEENSKLNASQASLITQFIGEWIFHKSVDIIRAGIELQYRESILQKVAFTVFDIAKKAVEKDLPQDQLISLVEAQVKKCFTKAVSVLVALLIIVGCVPATVLAEVAESMMMATGPDMAPEMSNGVSVQDILAQMNKGMVSTYFSPYEPYQTTNKDHPFLQGGSAWLDLSQVYYGAPATQNYPLTKWSANTSVYNITGTGKTYSSGFLAGKEIYVFPDVNLIDEFTWADYRDDKRLTVGSGDFENGAVNSADSMYHNRPIITAKNGNVAYAYNRYDAMQGKYGITFDKNVQTAVWNPSYQADYYGGDALFASVVRLSDTPYLYFSTEALDTTQISISLLIGAPVQKETLKFMSRTWVG